MNLGWIPTPDDYLIGLDFPCSYYQLYYDSEEERKNDIKRDTKNLLKTHYPLEYYWQENPKINYRTMPELVCKKLWHIKMDPLLKTLPNGAWKATWGGKCELCGKDPTGDFLEICFYKCEDRYLCENHIKMLLKFQNK